MNNVDTELARRIDHTLLKPEVTTDQIDALCDEVLEYGFATACVNPIHVRRAASRLANGSPADGQPQPTVTSVAGFPLGADCTATKVDQARRALDDGAGEIDMVISVGSLIEEDCVAVGRDIEAVARVVHESGNGRILKVILEAGALTTEQTILGCRCCVEAGADFVKTSTGFHPSGGATEEQVRLLCRAAAPLKVKASGGIRTAAQARAMLAAGAERLGTSAGVAIIKEA